MTWFLRLLHRWYERTFRIDHEQGYEPFAQVFDDMDRDALA